jgi:hypothetical protein
LTREGRRGHRPRYGSNITDVELRSQYIAHACGENEVSPERPVVQVGSSLALPGRDCRFNGRGGLLLDAVLSLALIVIAACALETLGVSFPQIFHAALRFFRRLGLPLPAAVRLAGVILAAP